MKQSTRPTKVPNNSSKFSNRFTRIKLPFIGGMLVAVLLAAGAFAFFNSKTLTPEQQFMKALENNLSTKTVLQNYQTSLAGSGTVTFGAKTDFTDPTKTKVEGPLKFELGLSGQATELAYDLLSVPDAAYLRFTSATSPELSPQNAATIDSLKGRWYKADEANDPLSAMLSESAEGIRTPLGEIITGNFNSELRKEILKKIATEKIYIIKENSTVTLDNKKLLKLKVSNDTKKVRELNSFVAKKLGIKDLPEDAGNVEEAFIFIDTKLSRIVRVEVKSKDGSDITITYSDFDKALNIQKPETTIPKDELTRLLGSFSAF